VKLAACEVFSDNEEFGGNAGTTDSSSPHKLRDPSTQMVDSEGRMTDSPTAGS
jgi:hypothetical protein